MLPTHGVSSKNNGLSGIPVINRTVALSIAWVIGSILAIVFGFLNCRSNSYSYLLQCDDKMCTYSSTGTAKVQPIHFLRSDILNVEVSRISMDGDIISPEDFKKGQRFGYSLSLHFKHSAVPNSRIKTEKIITFTPHDMVGGMIIDGQYKCSELVIFSHPGKTHSQGSGEEDDRVQVQKQK